MGIAVELIGLVGKTGGCLLLLTMGSLVLAWFWSALNSSRRLHEAQWQALAQRTGLTTRPGAFAPARVQGQFRGRDVSLDYLFRHWGRNGLFTRWQVALDNPAGHFLALHPAGGLGAVSFSHRYKVHSRPEALADRLLGDPGLRRRCLALPDCDVQLQGRRLTLIFREEITDPPLLASTLQLLCDLAERVEQIALPDTSPVLL